MATRSGEFTCWLSDRWKAPLQASRRAIWFLVKGEELPDDVTVGVTCGRRTCLKPRHLVIRPTTRKPRR